MNGSKDGEKEEKLLIEWLDDFRKKYGLKNPEAESMILECEKALSLSHEALGTLHIPFLPLDAPGSQGQLKHSTDGFKTQDSGNVGASDEIVDAGKDLVGKAQVSADQGNIDEQYSVGCFYKKGINGAKRDHAIAFKYFKLAADQGLIPAKVEIGSYYLNGKAGEKDAALAFQHFQFGAEKGDAESQCHLGIWHKQNKEYDQALKYFKMSSDQGNAQGQWQVGLCYQDGLGVEVDLNATFKFFELSANQGCARGEFHLGRCYYEAKYKSVVENNDETFMRFLKISAEKGDDEAQVMLGSVYEWGLAGVTKDLEIARKWYQLAALEENANGQFYFACLLEKQLDGEDEHRLVVNLYRSAAEQGHAAAQYHLGVCFEEGFGGLPKDLDTAWDWYLLSAAQDHIPAQARISSGKHKSILVVQ